MENELLNLIGGKLGKVETYDKKFRICTLVQKKYGRIIGSPLRISFFPDTHFNLDWLKPDIVILNNFNDIKSLTYTKTKIKFFDLVSFVLYINKELVPASAIELANNSYLKILKYYINNSGSSFEIRDFISNIAFSVTLKNASPFLLINQVKGLGKSVGLAIKKRLFDEFDLLCELIFVSKNFNHELQKFQSRIEYTLLGGKKNKKLFAKIAKKTVLLLYIPYLTREDYQILSTNTEYANFVVFAGKIDNTIQSEICYRIENFTIKGFKVIEENNNNLSNLLGGNMISDISTKLHENIYQLWESWIRKLLPNNDQFLLAFGISFYLAYELILTNKKALTKDELKGMSLSSITRLDLLPKVQKNDAILKLLASTPFYTVKDGYPSSFFSIDLMNQIIANWIAEVVANEAEPVENIERLIGIKMGEFLGRDFIYPILGGVKLHRIIINHISKILKTKYKEKRKYIIQWLKNTINKTKTSSYYNVTPWKFLGANTFEILYFFQDNKISGDFSNHRLAGLNAKNMNLKKCNFRNCILTNSIFYNTKFNPEIFYDALLIGAQFNDRDKQDLKFHLKKNFKDDEYFNLHFEEFAESINYQSEINYKNILFKYDKERIIEPIALTEKIQNGAYIEFTKLHYNFNKENVNKVNPDKYYLQHLENHFENDAHIFNVGLNHAFGYQILNPKQPRLPLLEEIIEYIHINDYPKGSEWVWGNISLKSKYYTYDELANINLNRMPSIGESDILDGWSGLVVASKNRKIWIDRVLTFNCNSHVSFRNVVDYVYLINNINL